ncbi:hypothetical protein [Aquimarina latercula]|uniref:hypothetical protein n=1 Tax=Aquimarina latercula TaxID=987 RepID=UPI000422CF6B|nr:hypothetical protein [Aquimarina latercula]
MAHTKDLDYKAAYATAVFGLLVGMAVGAFYVAPKLEKRKAKKLAAAAAKAPQVPNKKV